jgi:alcohol dehydrogenase class IV
MGASHTFGQMLGALFDVPHGITSCVMLPAVMTYNRVAASEGLALCADVLGEDPAAALRRWIAALGLPTRLSEIGVGREHRAAIVEALAAGTWLATNPRPISGPGDIEAILDLAE